VQVSGSGVPPVLAVIEAGIKTSTKLINPPRYLAWEFPYFATLQPLMIFMQSIYKSYNPTVVFRLIGCTAV
jgi:hypothetical protein